jgi:hypothetical protein
MFNSRPITPHTNGRSGQAQSGFVLAQFAVMAAAMLAFLGVAIYYGQIGLLQNELQKNSNMAALIGAAAMYDGPTQGPPVRSPTRAQSAATNAFNRAVTASPLLQNMAAQLTSVQTPGDTVQTFVTARMPTPFFNLIGISNIQINANGRAIAAKEVVPTIGAINGTTPFRLIPLRQPLLDGPGPDMHIIPFSMEGYIPEVCAGNADCYPVSTAAKPVGTATVSDRVIGGNTTRLLFGEHYIDLGATGPTYAGFVKKANQIKLTHDGVDDEMAGGTRFLYLAPPVTGNFGRLEVFHHSVLCDQACTFPLGFAPMS